MYYSALSVCSLNKWRGTALVYISKFRLTYDYKLVGMMSYEKLAERDIDQFRFPFETVRLRLFWKIYRILISSKY